MGSIVLFIKLLFSLVFLCLGVGWSEGRREDKTEFLGSTVSIAFSVVILVSALGLV
jgi:hypothetical protein